MGEKERGGSCSNPYAKHHEFLPIGSIQASPRRLLFGCCCGILGFQRKGQQSTECFMNGLYKKAVKAYANIVKDMEAVGPVKVRINKTGFNLGFGKGFTI